MDRSFVSLLIQASREPASDDEDLPAIEDMQPRVQQEAAPVFIPPSSLDTGEHAPAEEPQSTNRQSPSRLQVRQLQNNN
jgi:hypothetical protein